MVERNVEISLAERMVVGTLGAVSLSGLEVRTDGGIEHIAAGDVVDIVASEEDS